jgi:hypothetical protein
MDLPRDKVTSGSAIRDERLRECRDIFTSDARRRCLPARLRGHRVKAVRLALSLRAFGASELMQTI